MLFRIACLVVIVAIACSVRITAQNTPNPPLSGDRVQCANLVYAGNKTSECFSDQFLTRIQQATHIKADPHFHSVRLDGTDLWNYPYAIMTGSGKFSLSPKERSQLRRYLERGGFVLASSGCSDPEWGRCFRAELGQIFPGRTLTRLGLDHPIFRIVYKIDSLALKQNRHAGATIEALTLGKRMALVFSSDGMNDTDHTTGCCCCGGDEIDRAEFINVNVLAYALMH